MLKSMLFNYSDAYTLFKGTIYKIMTKKKQYIEIVLHLLIASEK